MTTVLPDSTPSDGWEWSEVRHTMLRAIAEVERDTALAQWSGGSILMMFRRDDAPFADATVNQHDFTLTDEGQTLLERWEPVHGPALDAKWAAREAEDKRRADEHARHLASLPPAEKKYVDAAQIARHRGTAIDLAAADIFDRHAKDAAKKGHTLFVPDHGVKARVDAYLASDQEQPYG